MAIPLNELGRSAQPELPAAQRDFSAVLDKDLRQTLESARDTLFRNLNLEYISLRKAVEDANAFVGIEEADDTRMYQHIYSNRVLRLKLKSSSKTPFVIDREHVYALIAVAKAVHQSERSYSGGIVWRGYRGERSIIGEAIFRLGDDPVKNLLHDPYPLTEEEKAEMAAAALLQFPDKFDEINPPALPDEEKKKDKKIFPEAQFPEDLGRFKAIAAENIPKFPMRLSIFAQYADVYARTLGIPVEDFIAWHRELREQGIIGQEHIRQKWGRGGLTVSGYDQKQAYALYALSWVHFHRNDATTLQGLAMYTRKLVGEGAIATAIHGGEIETIDEVDHDENVSVQEPSRAVVLFEAPTPENVIPTVSPDALISPGAIKVLLTESPEDPQPARVHNESTVVGETARRGVGAESPDKTKTEQKPVAQTTTEQRSSRGKGMALTTSVDNERPLDESIGPQAEIKKPVGVELITPEKHTPYAPQPPSTVVFDSGRSVVSLHGLTAKEASRRVRERHRIEEAKLAAKKAKQRYVPTIPGYRDVQDQTSEGLAAGVLIRDSDGFLGTCERMEEIDGILHVTVHFPVTKLNVKFPASRIGRSYVRVEKEK